MNIYRYRFSSTCPTDGDVVQYQLEIQSPSIIKAEDIRGICAVDQTFHEDLADRLARLGGTQILKATHRSVEIETHRP